MWNNDWYYDEDVEHMEYYQACSKDARFDEYAADYIHGVEDHWEYLRKALTPQRIFELSVR